jgi:hypothetical protein
MNDIESMRKIRPLAPGASFRPEGAGLGLGVSISALLEVDALRDGTVQVYQQVKEGKAEAQRSKRHPEAQKYAVKSASTDLAGPFREAF